MKKILIALLLFVGVTMGASAQTTPAKTTTATHTKKDGTPDKRFKENKGTKAAPAAGPTKKDGTPDMRYKSNNANAGKAAKKKS